MTTCQSITLLSLFLLMRSSGLSCGVRDHFCYSDESGTQAVIARVGQSGLLAVDSSMSHFDPDGRLVPTLGEPARLGARKLADVGTSAACALAGFLGSDNPGYDISDSFRDWVSSNPDADMAQALPNFLQSAANLWINRLDRRNLRKAGDTITDLMCVSETASGVKLLRGRTTLQTDGSAATAVLTPEGGDIIYMQGLLETRDLLDAAAAWRLPLGMHRNAITETLLFLGRPNKPGLSALLWADGLSCAECWTVEQSQQLIKDVFTTVEKVASKEVGPPNQLRVFATCGRLAGDVDAPWPRCPSGPPTGSKN